MKSLSVSLTVRDGFAAIHTWSYRWGLSHKIEDVSYEELTKRAAALFSDSQ